MTFQNDSSIKLIHKMLNKSNFLKLSTCIVKFIFWCNNLLFKLKNSKAMGTLHL